jgi:regulator of cell morphogenesis and NO signaling
MQTVTEENILNVTLLEPRKKHPTIFDRFDELAEGQSLTIHNDHDPKPLYYQLLGERGNIFVWEYLEQGPQWWKVRITKRITGENDETLGQIAAKDLRKAEVFKKYGLDFCCGGKKTVKQACTEKGLDVTKIEQELQQADNNPVTRPLPYGDWSLDFLADYIVNTHHSYVKKSLPEIRGFAAKVAQVHGSSHPELPAVQQLVEEVNRELTSHMLKEEKVLFPYIKDQVAADNNEKSLQAIHFGTVQNPINMMEMEHEMVGKNMEEIRTLTNNYKLPDDACASYSLLFRMLDEFENDLHIHIHLENNILFPKALDVEKKSNS